MAATNPCHAYDQIEKGLATSDYRSNGTSDKVRSDRTGCSSGVPKSETLMCRVTNVILVILDTLNASSYDTRVTVGVGQSHDPYSLHQPLS